MMEDRLVMHKNTYKKGMMMIYEEGVKEVELNVMIKNNITRR